MREPGREYCWLASFGDIIRDVQISYVTGSYDLAVDGKLLGKFIFYYYSQENERRLTWTYHKHCELEQDDITELVAKIYQLIDEGRLPGQRFHTNGVPW